MADIVGIGCAVFDLMMILDRFPKEDEKFGARETKVQCGGPCAVALITASKMGISAAYQGILGDDLYGETIRSNLEQYGVDLTSVKTVPGARSPFCVVLSNQSNALRTCIGGGPSGPGLTMKESDVDTGQLKNAKILHLDGMNYTAALAAAKKAREYGVRVSMDADGFSPGHDELLHYVDILIPSEQCARGLAGTDDMEEALGIIMDRYRPETLVVTMGPGGGMLMENGAVRRYPAFPVRAIDSNGAGDVFHGAFLTARLKGLGDYEAAVFASAASAIKCTHFGASEGAPSYEAVRAFLAERRA